VDVVRLVVAFDAGFLAIGAFALDVLVCLLAVLAGTFAAAAPRTSLIALVCSCSVIRNSWCPSGLATK
jgi:hypothetical protein